MSRIFLTVTFLSAAMSLVTGCQRADELGPVATPTSINSIREVLAEGAGEADSGGAAAPKGTGWATLKGRFIYEGAPPQMLPYNVNKDTATCTDGGQAPLQETLLVDDATKGVKNIAVYIRKASRVHESAAGSDGELVFDQKECLFLTHVFPLVLGKTMAIKNSDNVGHNTNIEGKNGFNQTIPSGETIDFKPQKEETVPVSVRCSIHPWMSAYFLPRENGYVAITAEDGSFEIPNVPAGEELEFQVWHESATGPGGALVLESPAAKELKWSGKGRFKVKLDENEAKVLELTVPATAFGS